MGAMDADDYLSRYLPEFDTAEKRRALQQHTREDLIEMLLVAYKNTRLAAKEADMLQGKLRRIAAITQESLSLPSVDLPPPNFPQE